MHKHGTFFRVFLFVYLLFLVYHATELRWNSWGAVFGLASGIALALVAHLHHGYGMIILLLIHMGIEWSEYAQQGASYGTGDIVFYCVHTILDFAFLWQEVRVHLARYRYIAMGAVTLSIAVYFAIAYQPHPHIFHQEGSGMMETLVIGGILGCTLSHLLARKNNLLKQNLQQ